MATAALALSAVGPLAACGSAQPVRGASAGQGRELIEHYGCGACHTIGGIETANGMVGPDLTDFREKRSIARKLPNTPADVARWIQDPQRVKPNTITLVSSPPISNVYGDQSN